MEKVVDPFAKKSAPPRNGEFIFSAKRRLSTMTPVLQRMVDDMRLRNLAANTQHS